MRRERGWWDHDGREPAWLWVAAGDGRRGLNVKSLRGEEQRDALRVKSLDMRVCYCLRVGSK